MFRLALPAALLVIGVTATGCGGDTFSSADRAVCEQQRADLADVREAVSELTDLSDWAPGQAAATRETAGSAVTALSGYVADSDSLARAVDRARTDLQSLYDDLDDATLSGDGQTARTADASLSALLSTCA